MRHYIGLAAILVAGFGQSAAYAGPITLTAQKATPTSIAPFTLLTIPGSAGQSSSASKINLGNGVTASFTQGSAGAPYGGIYSGNTTNIAASPFFGQNAANYLVAEPKDPVTISYTTPQTNFDLLWGSVDSYNYLSITFCDRSSSCTTQTISGDQVAAAAGISDNGTTAAFVELSDNAPFYSVTLSTTGIAFEFVPAVPEPVTLSILATGLIGLGLARRRRQQPATR